MISWKANLLSSMYVKHTFLPVSMKMHQCLEVTEKNPRETISIWRHDPINLEHLMLHQVKLVSLNI